MAIPGSSVDPLAPIFVVVDDDREALNRLIGTLYPSGCFFISVSDPKQAVRYTDNFATTAVLIADPVEYPQGGTARLLQEILDLGKPVVILADDWSPEISERWRRMGARDCIPHPTRTRERFKHVARLIQDFTYARIKEQQATGQEGPVERKH